MEEVGEVFTSMEEKILQNEAELLEAIKDTFLELKRKIHEFAVEFVNFELGQGKSFESIMNGSLEAAFDCFSSSYATIWMENMFSSRFRIFFNPWSDAEDEGGGACRPYR